MRETIPLIDPAAATERLGGDRSLYGEIVNLFVSDAPQQLEQFFAALERGEPVYARRILHSLKSSAASVGAERLREACERLECAFSEQSGGPARSLTETISSLKDELSEVVRFVREQNGRFF